jgi:hypothetical protein
MRKLLLLLLLPVLAGWGPCGPITGGEISGEPVTEQITDWIFTDDHSTIQVETRPEDPYSVTTWCFSDGPNLYLPSRGAARKQWVQNVLADPNVRLRIGDKIYSGRAVRITDDEERKRLAHWLTRKYLLASWGMDPDKPEEYEDTWFFRVDPR